MDPIAMSNSALKALNWCKGQLDKSKASYENAKQLLRAINTFEVTISMIPPRGQINKIMGQDDAPSQSAATELVVERKKTKQRPTKVTSDSNLLRDAADFVRSTVQDQAAEAFSEAIEGTPLGIVMDFMKFVKGSMTEDDVAFDADKNLPSPAQIMEEMRADGVKDLEITFIGMAFVIQGALKVITNAIQTINKIEKVSCIWIIMPWKVKRQNELGDAIDGHFESIHKYNTQLLNAISIASYAVSLESLENVLNASNMISNRHMRDFWKKRIGIDKTRTLMSDLASAFLEETKELIDKSKENRFHLQERIAKQRVEPHVCLIRILSQLWNGNGDEWVSVYEVNLAIEKAKYKGKDNAIRNTLSEIIAIENAFSSAIKFTAMKLDRGADGIANTPDDRLEVAPKGEIVVLNPFERLIVRCVLPCFDPDIFLFDCICVMKYDRDPMKGKASSEFRLEELRGSRTYVEVDSNREFYDDDEVKWNAPLYFKYTKETKADSKAASKLGIDGFKGQRNFETTKIETTDEVLEEGKKESESLLKKGGVSHMKTILYAPVLESPGYYTVRYCLDDLEPPEDRFVHTTAPKKLALSPKSYYFDRSIDALQEGNTDLTKLISSSNGIGASNFLTYCKLMGHAIQLSIDEAKYNRDARAAVKYSDQMALLLNKRQKDQSQVGKKDDKKNDPKSTQDIISGDIITTEIEIDGKKGNFEYRDSEAIVSGVEIDGGKGNFVCRDTVISPLVNSSAPPKQVQNTTTGGGGQTIQYKLSSTLNDSCSTVLALVKYIRSDCGSHIDSFKGREDYLNSQHAEAEKVRALLEHQLVNEETAKDMIKREIALKRLVISFKVMDLIAKVELTVQNLKAEVAGQWVQDDSELLKALLQSQKTDTKIENIFATGKILDDLDECYKSVRLLRQLARDLIPSAINSSDTSKSVDLIRDPKSAGEDPHYVYDQNYGLSSIQDAMVSLKDKNLLVRYILFKQSAIQIDAIEAATQGHLARARARNKDRIELANIIKSVLEGLPSQATSADAETKLAEVKFAEVKPAEVKAAKAEAATQQDNTINTSATSSAFLHQKKKMGLDVPEAKDYLEDFQYYLSEETEKYKKENIHDREGLRTVAVNLLVELEKYVKKLFANSNMRKVYEDVQRSSKIIEDVKSSRDNAACPAQKTLTSSILASYVKRCLGFLVVVRDCNALAWAEEYSKPFHDDGAEKENQWRVKVDKYYPFGAIKCQYVNYTAPFSYGESSLTLNIFARVGKGKVIFPSDDQGKNKLESNADVVEIGVFRVRNEDAREDVISETVCSWYDGSKFVPMKYEIPADGTTQSLDFSKILEIDFQEKGLSKVKYAICFIKPPSKSVAVEGVAADAKAEAVVDKALCSKDDPKLTVVFERVVNDDDNDSSDAGSEVPDDENYDGTFNFNNYSDGYDEYGYKEDDDENATGRFQYDSDDDNVVLFKVAADSGTPFCELVEHEMDFSDFEDGDYAYGWWCNFCNRHGHGFRWLCKICSDDYCTNCACKFGPLFRDTHEYGSMTYTEIAKYVRDVKGTRLPTHLEVSQELHRHGVGLFPQAKPLFPQENMWWPISDSSDTWVNVGNDESLGPLGCKIENPLWSDNHDYFPQRAVIAYVRPPASEARVVNMGNDEENDCLDCAMPPPDWSEEDRGSFPYEEVTFSNVRKSEDTDDAENEGSERG